MNHLRAIAATASLLALGACGTHKSVAPVVYGTDPAASGRIYNSPAESAAATRPQRIAQASAGYTPPVRSAPTANVEPVNLQPVSSVYLSDKERAAHQSPAPARTTSTTIRTVSVRKGDTVYALGRRYDVNANEIIAANNLRAPYQLAIGQKIRIPAGVAVANAEPVRKVVAKDAIYKVRRGDTLYSISRATGAEVRTIAQANNLRPPYTISPGQDLLVPGAQIDASARVASAQKAPSRVASNTLKEPTRAPQQLAAGPAPKAETQDVATIARKASYTPPATSETLFAWPVRGNVVAKYGVGELGRRNDGVNIAAPAGTPVRAAADGEVVYRGSELDGFGNLLLIKHTDGYVTAYAHNDSMLVKKGDVVRKGQVIAKVGQTGAVSTPQLHFEIRQKLKSVDPIALLEK